MYKSKNISMGKLIVCMYDVDLLYVWIGQQNKFLN